MSTVAAAKPLSSAVPEPAGSSRPRRSRTLATETKTSPAPTNGSGKSGRSRISRSHSGNLSPEKPSSASIALPLKLSPEGSVTSVPTSPRLHPLKLKLTNNRHAPVEAVRLESIEPGSSYTSEPEPSDEEPEVIPAKKKRKFRYEGQSPTPPPSSSSLPAIKTEASTTASTPRIKLITVPRPRSRSKSPASSTPAPQVNGTDAAPTPSSIAMDEDMTREASQAIAEDERQAEAVISLDPDADAEEIAKIPDIPRRAPRKKRKWLKKGEVDPDDPVAVARQKERHAIIDEAIANLDAQEADVLSGEHPQLVLMWKELERRRYLQLARLQERLVAQKQDLVKMYDHHENQAWDNWDEIKDELVESLTHEAWRKTSQLHAEHIALKRLPNSLPSLRDGRGSGGWQLPKSILSNGKLATLPVRNTEGELRQRKAVPSQPDQLSHSELVGDLLALGIKGEITGRLRDVAPPKARLTKAQEEKKAESRKRTRAFSPPPPEARPRMTAERYKTIGDAFNEAAGPFEPLPLDQFGKPNDRENPYEGHPCPNPKLPDDVKVEAKPDMGRSASGEKK